MWKVTECVAEDSVSREREGWTFLPKVVREAGMTRAAQFPFIIRLLRCPCPLFHLVSQGQPAPCCHFALKGGGGSNAIFGRDPVSR